MDNENTFYRGRSKKRNSYLIDIKVGCFHSLPNKQQNFMNNNTLRRCVVSEQWSLKTVDCQIQVVLNIGFTV